MKATIDSGERILLPKSLRGAMSLTPGSKVDIQRYGAGLQITLAGSTACLARSDSGRLEAHSNTVVTDEMMFSLMGSGCR